MKHLLSLAIFSFVLLSCQPKDLPTVSDIHADFAEVKFSHMTTQEEMAQIKTTLKKVSNIDLLYEQSQFLENGKLQILKIGVKLPNGTKGSTNADLMTLQFKYFGFLYNPKSTPIFKIGAL